MASSVQARCFLRSWGFVARGEGRRCGIRVNRVIGRKLDSDFFAAMFDDRAILFDFDQFAGIGNFFPDLINRLLTHLICDNRIWLTLGGLGHANQSQMKILNDDLGRRRGWRFEIEDVAVDDRLVRGARPMGR